jgi:hypothetical protein
MAVNFEDETVRRHTDGSRAPSEALMSDEVDEQQLGAVDLVLGLGERKKVGRPRFLDAVAGTVSADTRAHIDRALLTLE